MVLSFPLFAAYIALVHGAERIKAPMLIVGLTIIVPGLLFVLAGYLSGNKEMA